MSDPLRDFIETSGFQDGSRLPPERELAEKLGVPRSSLRKMLARMEEEGLLTRHVGRGTFIGKMAEPLLKIAETTSLVSELKTYPAEVFEARLIIEPKLAALAAQRASAADLDDMHKLLRKSLDPASPQTFERWDSAFHKAVVRSSRNTLMIAIYDGIDTVRAGRLWGRLKERSLTEEKMALYRGHHEAILAAIVDRNSKQAEQLMLDHIDHARRNIIGNF